MSSSTRTRTLLAAVAGGASFAFCGAIQATHDFEGTHNTIDTTAEYLATGGLAVALLLTAPIWLLLARMASAPRAGVAAAVPQLVIASMCIGSIVNGEDAAFFNAVAPLCLLTWLAASVVIARGLKRSAAVPTPVALALPVLLIATFPLSIVGGPMLTGAFWMAVATQMRRGTLGVPAAQPAAA
jgi:hypothetical protein